MDERQQRVAEAADGVGAGFAIVTSADPVCYATGFEVPYETGPSPFAGGPQTALVAPDGTAHLIVANTEEAAAAASRAASVTGYEGFSVERPLHGWTDYADTVASVAREIGLSGAVAFERNSFPWSLGETLAGLLERLVPFDEALAAVRMVKTPDEILALRRTAAVASAGQREALRASAAGRTEIAVWADIRERMEAEAGGRVCVVGEYSSGPERTAQLHDGPRNRVTAAGEGVVCDLAPRVDGYWGDSCNTLVIGGEVSPELRAVLRAAQAGIDRAQEALRPGLTASAFDREVRDAVLGAGGRSYTHHSGHGIGVSVHENPRLVPGDHTILEAGMVIMVEPATYIPGIASARLEWMFLVTEAGNEVLTSFEHRVA